jgi:hypothetical protein
MLGLGLTAVGSAGGLMAPALKEGQAQAAERLRWRWVLNVEEDPGERNVMG